MSGTIIDRTPENKSKSSGNRSKFIKRTSDRVRDAVKDYITNDADIKNISDGKSKKVKISRKTLDQSIIHHDDKGTRKQVFIGNKDFLPGDVVYKPKSGQGNGGRDGGKGDESEDDFYFTLTHKEFLDIFFEDLELPDMIKKTLVEESSYKPMTVGFSTEGSPIRLDLRRTMINSIKRNISITGMYDVEIEELQAQLDECTDEECRTLIEEKLSDLYAQKTSIPFLQNNDLRYRRIEHIPIPITKAVMFCIMDVSGSMTEMHKEIAKRFFMILYLFLSKQYENVELVFIKHHHEAFEVNEQEFFYSRESGGTIVSKSIELANKIIDERYDRNLHNVYVCQASDGDNWSSIEETIELNENIEKLMNKIQYFAYVDIVRDSYGLDHTVLMKQYLNIKDSLDNSDKFNLRSLTDRKDIYPVFRSLFSKDAKERNKS